MWIGTDTLGNPYSIVIDAASGALITTPMPGVSPSTGDNSISVTALSLITSALRLVGVLATGETIDTASANDALMVFNQMLDAWNADRLTIFTTRADDYALIIGQQNYTLGTGGDFSTNRPARIDSMSVILTSNPANPIEVPISMYSVDDWQTQIPVKSVSGSFPLVCYDDGGFPLRTLAVWPIPSQTNNLRIYSWQPLILASTLTTAVSMPPGYAEAFRYNLAIRLAPEFDASPRADVQTFAVESLARLKSMNAPDLSLRSDVMAAPGNYNWRADMFGLGY